MYVCYKKYNSTNNNVTGNIVDALFNGQDIVEESVEDTADTETKTIIVDNYNDGPISLTSICATMQLVLSKVYRHPHPEEEYIHFKIPKKSGGLRNIDAPNEELKRDMKLIAGLLQYSLKLQYHNSAWAYIKGRDVVGATREHLKNKSNWYLKIDLHNFFGSCTKEFILQQLDQVYPFAQYKNNEVVREGLNKLVDLSLLNGSLPQGTPLSPMITNLIMIPVDYQITKLLNTLSNTGVIPKQRYVYTRYADDIIISTKVKFNYRLVLDKIKELFESTTPFTFNNDKVRFGSAAGRNWNLGIMCNKDYKATIGYRNKKQLKVMLHNYYNSVDNWELQELQWFLGQLSWLHNVEPDYYNGFLDYAKNKYDGLDLVGDLINRIKTYNS